MEMAEEKIAERIDANLLNVNIQEITDLPKQMFETKVNNLAKKTQGTLIIKEIQMFPLMSDISNHFLMNLLKKSFRPDIIFIDYLNICGFPLGIGEAISILIWLSSQLLRKLRGLAVKRTSQSSQLYKPLVLVLGALMLKLLIFESFGLPAADLMFALISTEEP